MPSAWRRMSGHCSFDINYFVSAAKRPYCFCDSILGGSGLHKMHFGISWSGLEDGKKTLTGHKAFHTHDLSMASTSRCLCKSTELCDTLHKITLPTSSSPKPMQVYAKHGPWVTCAKSIQKQDLISYLLVENQSRTSMNHDEPTFLVVATQQGLNQLGTTTPIEKAISNYQVTRKSPNASCQVPSVATPGVRYAQHIWPQ